MIVNRSFDEYVQNPLTAPEVLIIRRRIRLQSYVGIVFVLVFGLAFGGIAGAVHDDIVWAVPVALMAMLGGVTLWMNISDRVRGRLNVQAEFQIDDRWLMGGNDFSAFNYIDEHIDEVMDRYKAPILCEFYLRWPTASAH